MQMQMGSLREAGVSDQAAKTEDHCATTAIAFCFLCFGKHASNERRPAYWYGDIGRTTISVVGAEGVVAMPGRRLTISLDARVPRAVVGQPSTFRRAICADSVV